MELSSTTKAKVDNLKKQGYSTQEILAYFGAEKYGEMSVVHNEEMDRAKQKEQVIENSFKWRDIVATPGKYLAKDAVDVFGTKLARRGIGTDTSTDITQEYLDEPTKLQFAGAVLQSLGLAAGATSPLTLGRSVALGVGLGYSYDVGEDLVAQEEMKETLTPGLATIIGGGAPLAFAGIGAGVRALLKPTEEVATRVGSQVADDIGRATASVVRESVPEVATQPVTQAVDDLAKPVADKVTDASSEMARNVFNRFTRAGRHLQEYAEDKATRQVLRQDATPAMKFALDEGIETRTITRIGSADDVTRNAYKAVVQAAESGQPATAENVAGNYVVEMYKTARKQQDLIGEQLGEARRKLGNDIISNSVYQPTRRTMTSVFKDNGINLNIDGTVSFDTSKYIPEEEKVIQDIWSRVARYDTISPSEVDEIMQYLSKLEYRTNVTDKLSGVYIDVVDSKTGQVMPTNLFSYIRNTFDNLLEQVDTSGQIGALRKQYSQAKSVTSRVEDSWFSGLDIRKSTDSELSEAASLALRRLDSRAKSKTTYGQMYRALDKYARAFGYNGPDASDVSSFYLKEVEPLYPETTPPASFRGGIVGGIRSVLENVIDFGESNVTDKQKALRGLLGIEDIVKTPTSLTTKSTQQLEAQTETVLRDIEASQVESSIKNNISEIRRQSGQGGFANFFSNTTDRQQQTQIEGINDLISEWQRRALLPTATKSEINAANKAVNKLKKQLADILDKPTQ